MTRLIDADEIRWADHYDDDGNLSKYKVAYSDELPPTIDAVPVKRGKWIGYAGTIGNECSVCGKWIDVLQGTAEMNYCPNCGARMDAE